MTDSRTDQPVIRAENISRVFVTEGVEVTAFRNISVDIHARQMTAVMGPSGSGKSTLLHILGGIEQPTEGEVWLEGQKLSSLTDYELTILRRRKIGFIFQSFNLLPTLSVADNVTLPLIMDGVSGAEAMPRALECLRQVGMEHRLEHLPSQLSGGEQQRVAIARALVIEPTVILADEPTGNLDSARGREITQLLYDIAHQTGCTVVVVTHDVRVAQKADRLIVVLDGKIQFHGRPESDQQWIAALKLEIDG